MVFLTTFGFILLIPFIQALTPTPVVNTANGPVQGFVETNGIWKFQGIPYAAPPLGQLRFASPHPPSSWTNVLNATVHQAACIQRCHLPPLLCSNVQSEDCLYLNVYGPPPVKGTSYPVMVFIYGGAYVQGTSNSPLYTPDAIVLSSHTIVVTFEYRLGAFGFFTNNEAGGNFAIQDQRTVLKWVQQNIAQFGGDTSRVTVFGESAGGMSISVHLISPQSAGLFHAAIIESDPFSLEIPSLEQSMERSSKFSGYLNCSVNDLNCLRSKSASDVLDASSKTNDVPPHDIFNYTMEILLPWRPVLSDEVPNQILIAMQNGQFNKVPIILGTNTNEGIWFVYDTASFLDNIEYSGAVVAIFRESSLDVLEEYPPPTWNPTTDLRPQFSVIITDYVFACSTRYFAQVASKYVPVYLYHYDHVSQSANQFWPPNMQYCWDRVCHGSELPLVFGSAEACHLKQTPEEALLSQQMVTYWTNFAANKSPNSGAPVQFQWPLFTTSTKSNIKFDVGPLKQESYLNDYCTFWDGLGYFF